MISRPVLPIAAAAVSGVLVGSAIVATRFVIHQTHPASLAFLRYSVGFCCLLLPLLVSPKVKFERNDLLPVGLLGIIQFGVLIALMNYALRFIPSARVALIFACTPLLTMVLAVLLGYERLTLTRTAGVALTVLGVGLAIGEKAVQQVNSPNAWMAELAVLGSALSGAICSILYRPYLRKYPTQQVSAFAMLASLGFLALLAATEGFFGSWPNFTLEGWLAIAFIGVSSGIGYFLWLWALNHTNPTSVTVFLALSPVTATGLGAVLLAEPGSAMLLVGLGCVAFGLWLAHRRIPLLQNNLERSAGGTRLQLKSSHVHSIGSRNRASREAHPNHPNRLPKWPFGR